MKKQSLTSFLARQNIGLILQVYAHEERLIPERIKMVQEFVERALSVQHNGRNIISRIDIMVWADKKYADSDCGKTAAALEEVYPQHAKGNKVFITNFTDGDLFCSILNYGVAVQSRAKMDYSIIASSEAFSYFNQGTLEEMIITAQKGALVVRVAINELTDSILHGRIYNTFAMWNNLWLQTYGGFDLEAANPTDDKTGYFLRSSDPEKGEIIYSRAGVEEIRPLVRLVQRRGQCLATILPQGDGVRRYQVPDPQQDKPDYDRHWQKIRTKKTRQDAQLAALGCDELYLEFGIMPEYRII